MRGNTNKLALLNCHDASLIDNNAHNATMIFRIYQRPK